MPRVDSADFQAWLNTRSGIEPAAEHRIVGCEKCGVSGKVYPLVRGHCVVCLGYMYGQFVKCQQLVMWLEMNVPLVGRGDLNERAASLVKLGQEYRLPRADETDAQFARSHKGFAER